MMVLMPTIVTVVANPLATIGRTGLVMFLEVAARVMLHARLLNKMRQLHHKRLPQQVSKCLGVAWTKE